MTVPNSIPKIMDHQEHSMHLLTGSIIPSFAYTTIKDRLPIILTKAIDAVVQETFMYCEKEHPIQYNECKSIISQLTALKYEASRLLPCR